MPKFRYIAITPKGQRQEDTIEAASSYEVIKILEDAGLVPVKIEEQGKFFDLSSLSEINIGGIPLREKVLLFKQLSLMFNAGLPLSKIFEILTKQELYPPIKRIIKEVSQDVLGGEKLHAAFAKHPQLFDSFTVALIHAGEESGQLDMIFRKLSQYYTKKHKLNNSLKSALAYPIAVLVIVVLVLAFILWFILPQMYDVFMEFRVNLPLTTRILMFLSISLKKYYLAYLVSIITTIILLWQLLKIPSISRSLSFLWLKLPFISKVYTQVQISSILGVFSLLLSAGIPIVKALELTEQTTSNYWYKLELQNIIEYVKVGKKISDYLKTSNIFPPMLAYLFEVGEETGEISDILNKIARFYEREARTTLSNMSSVLQPILILLLGIIVAILIAAIYLPLSQLAQNIG